MSTKPPFRPHWYYLLCSQLQRRSGAILASQVVASVRMATGAFDRINEATVAISRPEDGPPLLMDTPVHRYIVELVYTAACSLHANLYRSVNGQATMALVGHRGCGKTSTLKALEAALPLLPEFKEGDSKLLVCYIATDRASIEGSALVIPRVAASLGRDFDGVETPDDLAKKLELIRSRLVLFVDELDGLYEAASTQPEAFNELSELGDGLHGRVVVVLCGSHAFIPFLIKNASVKAANSKFHALGVSTRDLNRTKYNVQHVPLGVLAHTDAHSAEAAASNVLSASNAGPAYSPEVIRGMLFYAGCRVRYLQQLASLIEGPSTAPQPDVFGYEDTGLDAAAAYRVMQLDAKVLEMLRGLNAAIVSRYGDGSAVFQQPESWPAVVGLDVQQPVASSVLWDSEDR